MNKCAATNAAGEPCQAWAGKNTDFCFFHDPARGAQQAAARRRGGLRLRPPHAGDAEGLPTRVRTLADVLAVLDYALVETLALQNSLARGRVLIALAAGYIEAIKAGEIEARLVALEGRVFGGDHTETID